MIYLSVDTSQSYGSLALTRESNDGLSTLATRSWSREKSHSEVIHPMLGELLEEAQVSLQEIQRIIIGCGPGSFTGVRVGLNMGKALAYSLGVPVIGVDSLEAMCKIKPGRFFSCVYGFRDIAYCCAWSFESGEWTQSVFTQALQAEKIWPLIPKEFQLIGNIGNYFEIPKTLKSQVDNSIAHPLSEHFVEIFADRFSGTDLSPGSTWREIRAHYVRDSEPEEKRKTEKANT